MKTVIYIPAGQVFTARDGKSYKAVAHTHRVYGCKRCAFKGKFQLCTHYRCVSGDREDRKWVHFIETKEQEI